MLSALKNFAVTFLLSALIFGVIAYFATGLVTNTVGEMIDKENDEFDKIISGEELSDGSDETDKYPTDEKVPEGESFNFLVAVTDARPDLYEDYQPSVEFMYNTAWGAIQPKDTFGALSTDYRKVNLTSIVAVRIDKETREFLYTYYSPEIRVYTSTGYHSLSEVYELYGIDRIAEHIYAMSGLKIKYKVVVNGYNLEEMYTLLENVELVPAETDQTTDNGEVTAALELTSEIKLVLEKDIYFDGKQHTMQYETVIKYKDDSGQEVVEHKPNTYVLGKGEHTLNSENIYAIITSVEHSSSELAIKESLVVGVLQKYLNLIASMDEEGFKTALAHLMFKESEWDNIAGSGVESEAETGGDGETEPEDGGTRPTWIREAYEPDDAIIQTNFTLNEFDDIYEMLCAVKYFVNRTVTYPMSYVSATEDEAEYFEADITSGIQLFMDYRG